MFTEMRRKKQQLSNDETTEILEKCTSGVLALLGNDGYPYAVPLSYVYHDGKIYFHCALTGHKIEAVKHCSKASFCVILDDIILPEKYTSVYRSVIAFGNIRIVSDPDELKAKLAILGHRYNPDDTEENLSNTINESLEHVYILELDIEHITGKEGIERTRLRNKSSETL